MTTPNSPRRPQRFVPRLDLESAAPSNSAAPRGPLSILLDHPTLLFALVASALVIYRALLFTDFQIPAALAVLSTGGLEGVLLASAAALLPILAPAGAYLAAAELLRPRDWGLRGSYWPRVGLWATALMGAYVAFSTTPMFLMVVVVGLAVWGGNLYRQVRQGLAGPLVAASFVIGVLSVLAIAPWLPSERITIGSETFTGYVLEESTDWTQVLLPGGRLVIASSGQVTERVVCTPQLGVAFMTAYAATLELLETFAGVAQPDRAPPCLQ